MVWVLSGLLLGAILAGMLGWGLFIASIQDSEKTEKELRTARGELEQMNKLARDRRIELGHVTADRDRLMKTLDNVVAVIDES